MYHTFVILWCANNIRALLGFTGVRSWDPVWWVYTAHLRNEPQEESLLSKRQVTNIEQTHFVADSVCFFLNNTAVKML